MTDPEPIPPPEPTPEPTPPPEPEPEEVKKPEKEEIDPFDPDLDAQKLYGDHIWVRKKWVKMLYKPLWSVLSKDFKQHEFLSLPREKRIAIIKEKAGEIRKDPYYRGLPSIADVVGRDKEISIFLNSLYYHILRHPEALAQSLPPPKVFLVKGEPGSGKSFLIKAVMKEAFDRALDEGIVLELFPLEGAAITGMFVGMLSGGVRSAFENAQKKPTFLFVDEAQQLTQKGSSQQGDSGSREYQMAESAMLQALDSIMSSPVRTIVVLGSNTAESIREDIRRRAFLVDLDTPGMPHDGMVEIVRRKLIKLKLDLDAEKVIDTLEQALRASGEGRIVPHDIQRAFDEVINESERPLRESFLQKLEGKKLERLLITYDSFKAAAGKVRAYKEQELTQSVKESEQTVPPSERYPMVGGLKGVKDEIIKEVTLSLKPEIGGPKWIPPRGYLFYGPPGTGKTLLAKAIAGENKVPFFLVKGPSLMQGLVGESEKGVRQLFARARAKAPSIIFMDEIDAIGQARGRQIGGNAPVTESMLTALLNELDGFNPKGKIVFIGATNQKQMLDPALLERLDKQFEFAYPKTTTEKLDVIRAQWNEYKLDSEVTAEQILKLFLQKSFSPRVCADVIKEAARMAQMESIACKQLLEALALTDPNKVPDEQKQRQTKEVFQDEFKRIQDRLLTPEPVKGEDGTTTLVVPDFDLIDAYRKIGENNPINLIQLKKAFEKKAETEEDKELRVTQEMHRNRESEIGKGYGLAVDNTGNRGIFGVLECLVLPAFKNGSGKVKVYGSVGKGILESAYIGRDLIRQFNPRIMDFDIDVHFISAGEGGADVVVDGPSAGQAILFTILSAWLKEPFNADVCMTGKVDFKGIAGMVGGIQPKRGAGKLDAARENGFKYVLIPQQAYDDLKKDWQDYIDASKEQGTEIVGGKTWIDYAKIVFPAIKDLTNELKVRERE